MVSYQRMGRKIEYATLRQRIYALLIDLFLLMLPIYLTTVVVWDFAFILSERNFPEIYNEMQKSMTSATLYIAPELSLIYYVQIIAAFLLIILYFSISEVKMAGQSVGKIIINIKVIPEHKGQYKFKTALIRNFFRILDFPFGFFIILKSKKRQRAGDILAKTVVIVDK